MKPLRSAVISGALMCVLTTPVWAQVPTNVTTSVSVDQQRFADGLLSRGLHEMAIEEYRKILVDDPDYAKLDEVLFRLGEAYRKMKKGPPAEQMYLRVVREFPTSAYHDRAAFRRAELYVRNGKYLEAVNLMRTLLESDPSEDIAASASYYAGYSMKRIALTAEAEQQFKKVLEKYPSSPYQPFAALELASMYRANPKTTKEASKMYDVVTSSDASPRIRAEAYFQLGDVAYDAQDYQAAVAAYSTLRKEFPGDQRVAEAAVQTGWAYFLSEDWGNLTALCDAQSGGEPVWGYFRANALRASKKPQEALPVYTAFLAAHPSHRLAWNAGYEEALCAFSSKKYQQVVDRLSGQQPSGDHVQTADRVWLLAQAQLKLDQVGEAGKSLEAFVLLESDSDRSAVARYELARQSQVEGRSDSAAEQYRNMQIKHPKHQLAPQALYAAGHIMAAQENFTQAVKDWNRLLTEYPASELTPKALMQKALAQVRLKQFPEAETTFKIFLKTEPDVQEFVEASYWLGQVQEEQGKNKEAGATYEAAIAQASGHERESAIRFRLAGVAQALGDSEKAAALYQEVLDSPEAGNMPPSLLEWLVRENLTHGRGPEAVHAAKVMSDGQADGVWKQIALFLLGEAHHLNKDRTAAITAYKQAFEMPEKSPEGIAAGLALGEVLLAEEQADQAKDVLTQVVEKCRGDEQMASRAKATFLLGQASQKLDDAPSAARYFMSVAILYDDPKLSPEALYQAAEAYDKSGATKEALSARTELSSRYPTSEWAAKEKKTDGE